MIQIVVYEEKETGITIGFRKYNFLVSTTIGFEEGLTKEEYLQKAYKQCKKSIDYETDRYLLGKSNSRLTDLEGEEFIPELAKVKSLSLTLDKRYIQFIEGQEIETVELSIITKDQYNELIIVDSVITSDYGTIEDNILTIPKVDESRMITVSAMINDLSDIKLIYVYPYVEYVYDIDNAKIELIRLSKDMLTDYLENNPLQFLDGKYYSVTREKQNLLSNAIAVYQMKIQAGIPAEIKWNATGEECSIWTIEGIIALALGVAAYVEPLVSYQQSVEMQIKNCTTQEEIESIVIDYATV